MIKVDWRQSNGDDLVVWRVGWLFPGKMSVIFLLLLFN